MPSFRDLTAAQKAAMTAYIDKSNNAFVMLVRMIKDLAVAGLLDIEDDDTKAVAILSRLDAGENLPNPHRFADDPDKFTKEEVEDMQEIVRAMMVLRKRHPRLINENS